MKTTTTPNETIGIYSNRSIHNKAEVFPEMISLNTMDVVKYLNSRAILCDNVDRAVAYSQKLKRKKLNLHALVVVVDERGHACVYDSLAQRGGESLKKDVELHRLMLSVALTKALPGFVTDLTSFFSALVCTEEIKTDSKVPLEAMTTKAVWKMVPEWLKKMYNELKPIEL